MATISTCAASTATWLPPAPCAGQEWEVRRAQRADMAAVKVLFGRLHAFNAALDARFALSDGWEPLFDAALERALQGDEAVCFIARETQTDLPCGFALAAVHRDSDLWRYHEWVEVEALYVEDRWRGRGLAEALLERSCDWAECVGQLAVQLYVTASNERAIRFYQHAGFRTTQEIMRKVFA